MNWMTSLEKRFGSWAIPHLAVYLIAIQAVGVLLLLGNYVSLNDLILHGSSVMDQGQHWRLFSFMMIPSVDLGGRWFLLWIFISFMVFYLIGSALEQQWGAFRFNLFVLFGYLFTVIMAFVNPGAVISNDYLLGCVFLAFATLFPNFEFHLFFFIPVKVKWLGWLTFAYYVFILVTPTGGHPVLVGSKLGVAAAFANYALFFGKDVLRNFSAARRRKAYATNATVLAEQPKHQCAECGATDKSDPNLHFRYCSSCGKCFCEKHMAEHRH
jgi:hypothetical protein